jgi:predicted GNAT family acetyltransferase
MDAIEVRDDAAESRLVVRTEGAVAELAYEVDRDRLLLLHTEVPEAFRGQGVGGKLVAAAVSKAHGGDLTIVPWCPYSRRWLEEHPEEAGRIKIDFTVPRPD